MSVSGRPDCIEGEDQSCDTAEVKFTVGENIHGIPIGNGGSTRGTQYQQPDQPVRGHKEPELGRYSAMRPRG